MSDTITLTGLVATVPRHLVTNDGLPITSFRIASTQRRFDRAQQKWVDGDTNWFTVTSFRQLALNVAPSLHKGQRVLVTGRLRIRDWEAGERTGTNVEVDADAIGHDLSWGTASFTRSTTAAVADSDAAVDSDEAQAAAQSDPTASAESQGWAQTAGIPASDRPAVMSESSAENVAVPF